MKIANWFMALTAVAMLGVGCKTDKEPVIPPVSDGDYTGVVLNEICGGAADNKDDDWVEIYNMSDVTVDLTGVQLMKIDEDNLSEILCTLLTGTQIVPRGYLVVSKQSGAFSAGISNSKKVSIVLITPSGENEIDRFDRDAAVGEGQSHELGGSYARIPDGTGAWTIVARSTQGAANSNEAPQPDDTDYSGLVLNEVCGGAVDNDEDDWIELYNNGTETLDLAGVKILKTDEEGVTETIATLPEGTTVEAGGYRVFGKLDGQLSKKISNSKQVVIAVMTPAGEPIDAFDRDAEVGTDQGHELGGSYARIPDVTGGWAVVAQSTRGAANTDATVDPDPTPSSPYEGLALNELNGNDKFIELYNGSASDMDISGVQLRKDDEEIIYVAPQGTTIPAGSFLSLAGNAEDYADGFTSGLSADKSVMIQLLDPEGVQLDVFKNLSASQGEVWGEDDGLYNGKKPEKVSFGRFPDGVGDWYLTAPTSGAANGEGTEKIEW